MATQTAMVYSGRDGLQSVTAFYDDVHLFIVSLVYQNLSDVPLTATLVQRNRTMSRTVQPGTPQSTLTVTSNTYTLTLDATGTPQYNFTFTVGG